MSSALGLLEVAGLIRRAGAEAELEYIFRHTLLRETAYSSLLREERVDLHSHVGEAIERVYSHANGEFASVLAHHFLEGNQKDKAFEYLMKAGDEAARVYALAEALDHYGEALKLAMDGQGDLDQIQYLFERRGRMLELGGEYETAIEVYKEMEEFGRQGDKPGLQVRGLVRRANLFCLPNEAMNLKKGEELSKRALKFAEEQNDGEVQCLALWNLMKKCEFEEDYVNAFEYGQLALELAEKLNLSTQKAFILNDLGGNTFNVGRFEEGQRFNQEAQALWMELDNMPMLVDSLCNEMGIHLFQGSYDTALEVSERASRLSEKINNTWGQSFSRYIVYWVHFERGDLQQALETASECLRYAEEARFVVPLAQTKAEIGLMYAFMGDFPKALELTAEAVKYADHYIPAWKLSVQAMEMLCHTWAGDLEMAKQIRPEVEGYRKESSDRAMTFLYFVLSLSLPELALAEGEWELALKEAESSNDAFRGRDIKFVRPDFLLFAGEALLEMGRLEEAQEKLGQARHLMEENESRRSLWRAFSALARIAERKNDQARAVELRLKAKDVIEHIADHCPSPDLRASFMQRSVIQSAIHGEGNSDGM